MMQVEIPLHSAQTVLTILRRGNGTREGDREALNPVIEQLEGAIVQSGCAQLLLTDEEAQTAAGHIAIYGDGFDKKLSLLFDAAVPVEADMPAGWKP